MTAIPASTLTKSRPRQRRLKPKGRRLAFYRFRHQLGLAARWWLRRHIPFEPVFVLATYRSGSNLLVDYMNRVPGVRCGFEILCPTLPYGISPSQSRPDFAMRHICRSLHALKGPIRGCKLMLDQLAACGLSLDALNEAFPGAKYVILYRQSIAEQYLSRQSAKATDQWVLHEGQQPKQARVPIDPADLQSYGADIRQAYRQLLDHAWLPQRSVLLSYEELSTDPARCFAEQICPLLGLPPARPETMLRKQNTLPLDQRVANYCEVATLLSSSVCRQHYSWSHTQFLQQAASAAAN